MRTARRERDELLGALRSCFARAEVFTQAVDRKCVNALMSDLKERNGWAIAKFVGDKAPDKTQRLPGRAVCR